MVNSEGQEILVGLDPYEEDEEANRESIASRKQDLSMSINEVDI